MQVVPALRHFVSSDVKKKKKKKTADKKWPNYIMSMYLPVSELVQLM